MKNIITTIFLLATITLSAQKSHEGIWKCDYSDTPMGIKIIKNNWLRFFHMFLLNINGLASICSVTK